MAMSKPTLAKSAVICLGVVLIGWLLYQAPFVRELLVTWSTKLGPTAVPFVRHAMVDSDNYVRMAAYESMKELRGSAAPILAKNLEGPSAAVRSEAIQALMILGPESKGTLPVLVAIYPDADPECRANILRLIARIDEKNPAVK